MANMRQKKKKGKLRKKSNVGFKIFQIVYNGNTFSFLTSRNSFVFTIEYVFKIEKNLKLKQKNGEKKKA